MDRERYSRQVLSLGEKAHRMVRKARIVVVGCGAVGTHVCSHLARLGVSRIRIIDDDYIETSNLPRSALFTEKDVTRLKATIAMQRLKKINSSCEIEAVTERLTGKNTHLLEGFDLIVDCTDNMESRYVINNFSVTNQRSWIYGALENRSAFVAAFSGKPPCFSCIFPKSIRQEEREIPVFSPLPALVATVQASYAIKIITDRKPPFGKMLYISLDDMKFRVSRIKPDPFCEICGKS